MRVADAVRWYRELWNAKTTDEAEFIRGQLNARLQTFTEKQNDQYYAELGRVQDELRAALQSGTVQEIVHPNPGMEWDF